MAINSCWPRLWLPGRMAQASPASDSTQKPVAGRAPRLRQTIKVFCKRGMRGRKLFFKKASRPIKIKLIKLLKIFSILFACLLAAGWLAPSFTERPPLLDDIEYGKCVLDKNGNLLRMTPAQDGMRRLPCKPGEIPPYAVDALVRYEDQYFYWHPGVNPLAMLRGIASLAAGGRKLGASTITMQTARLKYRLATSTLAGKLRQIWLALLLERHYSKEEILAAYFTLAPYGGNIEGLEAASRVYFNKAAANLTPLEIQALVVVPQNPAKRNPVNGSQFEAARNRLRFLLDGERDALPPLAIRKPAELPTLAPHLASELARREAGHIINSTLEWDLQLMMEGCLSDFVERGRRYNVNNAAALIVNADTMRVVASVGSGGFFNEAIEGQMDGTIAKRSPGSTLKPFIYALALDQGLIHPATILPDSPRSFGGYDPENFDRGFQGPVSAAEALRASRNLPAILLAERLKTPDLFSFLDAAQIRFPHGPDHYGLALALGGAEISMRDLASLYAMLVNGGMWRPLKFTLSDKDAAPRRLLSSEAAWLALDMLERPDVGIKTRRGWLPMRFKTGTSNGLRDAWTAGTLGNYIIIAWVGNFDNSANPFFVGAKTALPLFQELAAGLASARMPIDRQKERKPSLNLDKSLVCRSTGDFAHGQCADTMETTFIPGVSPVADSGILRPVLIDEESGLRACKAVPGKTREIYWEFWPSDLKQIFASAGVYKPDPPEWLPGCGPETRHSRVAAPRIILPKKNIVYCRQLGDNTFKIPLLAAADSEAGAIHWYAGNAYIGKAAPGETIFWHPGDTAGAEIMAVDERGNTSQVKCRLHLVHNPAMAGN